eukprot:12566759-Ditylum_brightwellii.AAC.1
MNNNHDNENKNDDSLECRSYAKAENSNDGSLDASYPVVQLVNGHRWIVGPKEFNLELVRVGTCTHNDIPLKLAWAFTVHKSQGLTLDYIVADVGETFADNQANVVLNCTSGVEGLEI